MIMIFNNKALPFFLFLVVFFFSCSGNKSKTIESNDNAIARVNNHYLYRSDIEGMGEGLSTKDSIQQLNLYIDKWATDQMILDMALQKLKNEEKEKADRLVQAYKNSLLISAYENQLISDELDTIVNTEQLIDYYNQNKEQYISGHNWARCHFIRINRNADVDNLRKWFKSEEVNDFEKLKQYCIRTENIDFVLNKDQWINLDKIGEMLPERYIEPEKIEIDKKYDRSDDKYLYLLRIFELRDRNSPIPFAQVKNDIIKIILQQRRSQILQKLRAEVSEKGKKGKVFERY